MSRAKVKYMVRDLTLPKEIDADVRLFVTEHGVIEYANEHYHETDELLEDYNATFRIETFNGALQYFREREYEVYEIKPIRGE